MVKNGQSMLTSARAVVIFIVMLQPAAARIAGVATTIGAGVACNKPPEPQCGEGLACFGANAKHKGICVSKSRTMPAVNEEKIQEKLLNVDSLGDQNPHIFSTITERTQDQLDSQLKDAAYYGELPRAMKLLEKGADPDSTDSVGA